MNSDDRRQGLPSERVVIESPMSFTGSARRIWQWPNRTDSIGLKIALGLLASLAVFTVWILIVCWYLTFGLLVVPWRLLRRRSRKRKKEILQHRELIEAMRRGRR